MNTNKIITTVKSDDETMYFIGSSEVSQPVRVDKAVILKDGREITAIAEGRKKHFLTESDIKDINITITVATPEWLSSLNATKLGSK